MERRFGIRLEELRVDAQVNPQALRGVLPRLESFLTPFVECLKATEQRTNAKHDVAGLVSDLPSQDAESIADRHDRERPGLPKFIGQVEWTTVPSGLSWSGRWDRCVHLLGVSALGLQMEELPARIYTPTVTDMLGAKLSKSLYVGDMYTQMPKGFADFNDFMEEYGEDGLNTLWQHIRQWPKDPAYMDRDSYTITYFMLLLNGKLDNANIMG